MYSRGLSHISAEAVVPEHLAHYVRAVSGRRAFLCGGYAAYVHEGHAVLAAYPGEPGFSDPAGRRAWEWSACGDVGSGADGDAPGMAMGARPPSLAGALADLAPLCSTLTVLAPYRPAEAPPGAPSSRDCYWRLPLPLEPPGQKLRNMLRRAARDLRVEEEAWGLEHQALVSHYLATRSLPPGLRAVYAALPAYAALARDMTGTASVRLHAARDCKGGLAAFALADCTSLSTAMYMFAFRSEQAPPGAADLLLRHIADEGTALGHTRLNLGLGINSGIAFFKKKWGAAPLAPYVETTWELKAPAAPRKSLLSRLFGS